MDDDWEVLRSFFPENWNDLAVTTGALKGLRKNKSAEALLRTLLIHLSCGHSLRETVVRAKKAGLADISDVALLKRLKKSSSWLHALCVELFQERGIDLSSLNAFQVRAFDATTKEPGKTGSLWRIHYSVCLPSLACDFFKLTETQGKGTGESFSQFPVNSGDHILADRGYSTPKGIQYVISKGAYVTVRVNTTSLPLLDCEGAPFDLLGAVSSLKIVGATQSWSITVAHSDAPIQGRLCVVRKSEKAIKCAQKSIRRVASKKGHKVRSSTLEYAKYIILFTTFSEADFSAQDVLQWYRIRWQVELVFKRFKSLAQLGHLPKYDDESAKAWLYGKLFVALLVEKLIAHGESISPSEHGMEELSTTQRMERI
jgi:hypothetical protein